MTSDLEPRTSRAAAMRSRLRHYSLVATVVAVEAIVLLGFCGFANESLLGGDGGWYHRLAMNMLTHGVFSDAHTPPFEPTVWKTPGYPAFLAAVYAVTGASVLAVRILQFCLLAVSGVLLYEVALALTTPRTSIIAALCLITYPPFVFCALFHLTETLAVTATLFIIALYRITLQRPTIAITIAIGLLCACLTLVRRTFAVFPGLLVLGLVAALLARSRKRAFAHGACLLAAYSLGVAPWAARNIVLSQDIKPFGLGRGWGLHQSMQQYSGEISYKLTRPEWDIIIRDYNTRRARIESQVEQLESTSIPRNVRVEVMLDDEFAREARKQASALTLRRVIANLPLRYAYLWSTGDMQPWNNHWIHRCVQLQFVICVLATIYGFYLCRGAWREWWPLVVVAIYITALHSVFHIEPRFTFPARACLFGFTAVAVNHVLIAFGVLRVETRKKQKGSVRGAMS